MSFCHFPHSAAAKRRCSSRSFWFVMQAVVLLLATSLCRADSNLNHLGYTLSWHDDFDGTNLDTTKWNITTGYNNANNELEDYATNNVYVSNGHLVLESDATTS